MTKAQLKRLKEATKKLTKWESSGKAFGHFKVLASDATEKKGADKIYEFYCLMKVLEDLKVNYKITLEPGTRMDKIFPEAPSPKNGWPFFRIENKKNARNKYQVCYGTKVKLSTAPRTTIAADISIQKHNSTYDPDETMVELIMDAKFKYDDSDALSIEQIHAFMQRVNALETSLATRLSLDFSSLTMLKTNCLLTNGRPVANHDAYCIKYNIRQVGRFDVDLSGLDVVG